MTVVAAEQEILDAVGRYQYDPHGWSLFAYDWGHGELNDLEGPRAWQTDTNIIIRDHLSNPETRYTPLRIAVASGHGIGKSAEMGMLSNWGMSCFDDARILVTANTDNQLRTKTAPEVSRWFRRSITGDWFDIQATSIKSRDPVHADTWRLDFVPWSAHNTEAFAGLHNKDKIVIILFDEASKIDDKVWEVTEGAMTDERTIIIWIAFGNPTRATGRFRECFRRFRHRWQTRHIDSRAVEGTNTELLSQWVQDYGEESDFVKMRVRGQFPSASPKQFISEADVQAACGRHLRPEQYNFAPVILTVDPAWEGDDELVIGKRQGLHFVILKTMPKNDNDVFVANLVARLEDEHKADAVFIDLGYGTGIVSAGRTMGRTWTLVSFSESSHDPGCLNKRAEMWKLSRDWLKEGGAIPDDQTLCDDLTGPETVARLDGKIQLESKQDMKTRGLPSPNRADALALSFAHPVFRSVPGERPARVQSEFDPFREEAFAA